MKKLLALLAFLASATFVHAQIVPAQNQITTPSFGGVVLSTSTSPTAKLGQLLGTSTGQILGWNGTQWTSVATSSLGLQAILSGTQGQVVYFSGTNTAVGTSTIFIDTMGDVGISSTTPSAKFVVTNASSFPSFIVEDSASPDATPFIIDTTGRVGIGTSTPSSLLAVSGSTGLWVSNTGSVNTVQFDDAANDTTPFVVSATGNTGVGTSSPYSKLAVTNAGTDPSFVIEDTASPDATPFIVTDSGDVGIGTTTPGGKFEVYKTGVQTTGTHFLFNASDSTVTNDADVLTVQTGRGTGADDFNLLRITTSGGDVFNVRQNGNVGVGTSSPYGKFSVTNTGTAPSFVVEDATSPDVSPFIIDASGNVGIGTSTPQRLLTLVNSGNNGQLLFGDSAASADLRYGSIGFSRGNFSFNTMTDGLASTTRLTILSGGNVGIGTTSPLAKLTVAGGDIHVGGIITATSTATSTFSGPIRSTCFTTDGSTCITGGGSGTVGSGTTGQFPYYAATGTTLTATSSLFLSTAGNVGIGMTVPDSLLTISSAGTSTALVAPQNGTLIHLASAGSGNSRITGDVYTSGTTQGFVFQGRKARGGVGSPTAVNADDTLAVLGGVGYGTTGFPAISAGAFVVRAEASGTDTSQPTYLALLTTPTSTITPLERLRVTSAGLVGIGTSTPGSLLSVAGNSYFGGNMIATGTISLTSTGSANFGDGLSLEIPNSTNPTVDAAGEIAIDTTAGQFKWFDGVRTQVITGTTSPAFMIASTTQDGSGRTFNLATTSILLKNPPEAITLTGWYCKASSTGYANVRFGDGTNWTNIGLCTTAGNLISASSNNSFTAFEDMYVQVASTSTVPSNVTVTTIVNTTAN